MTLEILVNELKHLLISRSLVCFHMHKVDNDMSCIRDVSDKVFHLQKGMDDLPWFEGNIVTTVGSFHEGERSERGSGADERRGSG